MVSERSTITTFACWQGEETGVCVINCESMEAYALSLLQLRCSSSLPIPEAPTFPNGHICETLASRIF